MIQSVELLSSSMAPWASSSFLSLPPTLSPGASAWLPVLTQSPSCTICVKHTCSDSHLYSLASPSSLSSGMPGKTTLHSPTIRHFFPSLFSHLSTSLTSVYPNLVGNPVRARLVVFKSRREVRIPFHQGSFPADDYLKDTERVVGVTFPDSARIEYLGNSYWRSRLRPVTFFSLSAAPSVEIRVSYEKAALRIHSKKLGLDVTGLPDNLKNVDLQFSLQGQLRVCPCASAASQVHGKCNFDGWVSLGLGVDLPLPLSLLPEELLIRAGDEVLDRIIGAMEGALLQGIISDYHAWCQMQNKQSLGSLQPPVPVQIPRISL